jgi:hypothetical protein
MRDLVYPSLGVFVGGRGVCGICWQSLEIFWQLRERTRELYRDIRESRQLFNERNVSLVVGI